MNEPPPPGCPECSGPIRRVIHPVGIMFKGSGFYATDSRQSAAKPAPEAKKEASADKAAGDSSSGDSPASTAPSGDAAKAD
jgi:predicted nucleic acid-binding Zn ribbon protein